MFVGFVLFESISTFLHCSPLLNGSAKFQGNVIRQQAVGGETLPSLQKSVANTE